MKKIYFVLTYTGTILSKIVKVYTKKEFSHSSISLDEDLNEMYSFARKNAYNPFIGGLMHEYIHEGTFKRFYKTKCIIYSFEITNKEYEKIKENIMEMYAHKDKYKFNIIGLLAVSINKKIKRENYYYCTEFVKEILDKSNVKNNLPDIPKPEDLKDLPEVHEVYQGLLKDYR